MNARFVVMCGSFLALADCSLVIASTSEEKAYAPPEASGLVGVRPYPTPTDVCQVIGEDDLTFEYLDHTQTLVGCPNAETGAIADRMAEGGEWLKQVGGWVLFSIPDV